MPARAKLLVCEKVLPEGNAAAYTRILDIVMLLSRVDESVPSRSIDCYSRKPAFA